MPTQIPYIRFGKFLLLDRISVGGMAEVYRAKSFGEDPAGRLLAIKKLLPAIAEDDDFVEMFINEAQLASQLTHANICRIYDLGKSDGALFIAMEYVWGKDLLQLVSYFRRRKDPMPPPMAAYIATRVCEGIDYAYHKRGPQGVPLKIIHRDVSPQNVLVSYEGEVKLIDFGIAKATLHHSETQAGLLKGKFSYMSPEQVQGMQVDHRSDIFAIGTCLFEMLTGVSLFKGENDFMTLEKVKKAQVPRLTDYNPKVPAGLEKIVLKSLSLDPDERWQRAADFQDALQRFLITTPPIFTAKRLADWMRVTFADDVEMEKKKLEEYANLGPEALRQSLPPAGQAKSVAPRRPEPKKTLLGMAPPSLVSSGPPAPPRPEPVRAEAPGPFDGAGLGGLSPDQATVEFPTRQYVQEGSPQDLAMLRASLGAPKQQRAAGLVPPPYLGDEAPTTASPAAAVSFPAPRPAAPQGGGPSPLDDDETMIALEDAEAEGDAAMPVNPTAPTVQTPFTPAMAMPPAVGPASPFAMARQAMPQGAWQAAVPPAEQTPAPVRAKAADDKQKIVAIPKTDGKLTTTTLKSGNVEFEEDEEPTRALDEDLSNLAELGIDPASLGQSSQPVYSSQPLSRVQAAHLGYGHAQQPGPAPQPQPYASYPAQTGPRSFPPQPQLAPPGTVAIGPDGKPILISFLPQKQAGLSKGMKWVLVSAFVFTMLLIGGVVVVLLINQVLGRDGRVEEPAQAVALKETEGAVLLRIVPSTAHVRVNGREVTPAELDGPIPVPAKVPVEIEVWQDGFKREKFPLLVPPRNTITKEIALKELRGRVIVNSLPDKAEVYVGGVLKGETPLTIDEFPIDNKVQVAVRKKEFETWSEEVELTEDRTERTLVAILQKEQKSAKLLAPVVTAPPEPAPPKKTAAPKSTAKAAAAKPPVVKQPAYTQPATTTKPTTTTKTAPAVTSGGKGEGYFIALTKPWARVLIDGKDTGRKTPIVPTNPIKLNAGSYKVTFVLPTGESYDFPIKVKAGEQVKLIKNFEK